MKNVLYQQLIGSLDVDVNYFHSQHSFNMFKEMAQMVFNDAYVKDHINTFVELGGHVDETYFTGQPKHEVFTFIYNHRLAGYKNYMKTLEMFDALWAYSPTFRVIFTCGDNANEARIKAKPYAILKSFKNYQMYIDELQKCHANVTNSLHETFCIAIAESIQADHIVLAPNGVTFPELLGSDYPYLFSSDGQQFKMMQKLLDDNIREYKHKVKLTQDRSIEHIKQLLISYDYKKQVLPNIKNDAKKAKITEITANQISFKELIAKIRKLDLSDQSFPPNKVALLAQDLGYKYNIKQNYFYKKS
jgi:hypothetical protein